VDVNKNLNINAHFQGAQASQGIDKLKSSIKGLTGVLGYAAGGLAFMELTKRVINLDSEMIKLRQAGMLTADTMIQLKKQVFSVALASKTGTDEILKMSTAALTTSHDIGFVTRNMKFMADVANATGMDMGSLGGYLGDLQLQTKLTDKGFQDLVGRMVSMSHMPGVESGFEKLAPDMGQIAKTFITQGGNPSKLFDMFTVAAFTKNPSRLARSMIKTLSTIKFADVMELGLKESDLKNFDVMKIIEAVTKRIPTAEGRAKYFRKIFGFSTVDIQAIELHKSELQHAKDTANLGDVAKLAAEKTEGLASSLAVLKVIGDKFADSALTPYLEKLASAISKMAGDPNLDKYLQWVKDVAIAFVGWKVITGLLGGIGSIAGVFGAGKTGGKPGLGLGQLGTSTNPMYVIVAGNTGLGGGVPGMTGKGGAALEMLSSGVIGSIATVALPVVGMIMAGYFAHQAVQKQLMSEKAYNDRGADNLVDPITGRVYRPHAPTEAEKYPLFTGTNAPGFVGPPRPNDAGATVNFFPGSVVLQDETGKQRPLKVVKKQMRVTHTPTQDNY
jgi:hypothetical protein